MRSCRCVRWLLCPLKRFEQHLTPAVRVPEQAGTTAKLPVDSSLEAQQHDQQLLPSQTAVLGWLIAPAFANFVNCSAGARPLSVVSSNTAFADLPGLLIACG